MITMKLRKSLLVTLLLLFSLSFIGCGKSTGNTTESSDSSDGSSFYYRYSFHPYNDTHLFIQRIGGDGDSAIVNDEKYYIVDTKNGQAKQVFENLPGEIMLDDQAYTRFDPHNFVALYRPKFTVQDYEIGRFQLMSQAYTPFITGSEINLLYDFVEKNQFLFTMNSLVSEENTEVYWMNRDGSSKQKIDLILPSSFIYDYHVLNDRKGCFYGLAGASKSSAVYIFDTTSLKVKILMEENKRYRYNGLFQDRMIISVIDQHNVEGFYLYDFEGTRINKLFTIEDINTSGEVLLDSHNQKFYYSYQTNDQRKHILVYDFQTQAVKEVYSLIFDEKDWGTIPLQNYLITPEKQLLSFLLQKKKGIYWCILDLQTNTEELILLPKNRFSSSTIGYKISPDSRYVLCMGIHGKKDQCGIVDYETKRLQIIKNSLEIDHFSPYYVDATQEFYCKLASDKEGKQLYILNPSGETRIISLFE
ncbi:MAG: hypothetical protein PHD83_02940 [Caldisericia bacterium]|nr:hypothetical protein [Caldisericia bacterium]